MSVRSQVALLHYTSRNLGDDVQTFAARRIIATECTLDRDQLQRVNCQCELILFGWLLQSRQWPPSRTLRVHPLSVHITPAVRDLMSEHIHWWHPFGTVSCRDTSTSAFLTGQGIPAEFDGCVTLSLRRWLKPEENCVVVVDVDTMPRGLPELKFQTVLHKTHKVPRGRVSDQGYRRAAAREVLEAYQRAELVVTSRLHAMLPCLAFGTPVVYVPGRDWRVEKECSRIIDYLPYVEVWDGRKSYQSGSRPPSHPPVALIERISRRLTSLRDRLKCM